MRARSQGKKLGRPKGSKDKKKRKEEDQNNQMYFQSNNSSISSAALSSVPSSFRQVYHRVGIFVPGLFVSVIGGPMNSILPVAPNGLPFITLTLSAILNFGCFSVIFYPPYYCRVIISIKNVRSFSKLALRA